MGIVIEADCQFPRDFSLRDLRRVPLLYIRAGTLFLPHLSLCHGNVIVPRSTVAQQVTPSW